MIQPGDLIFDVRGNCPIGLQYEIVLKVEDNIVHSKIVCVSEIVLQRGYDSYIFRRLIEQYRKHPTIESLYLLYERG